MAKASERGWAMASERGWALATAGQGCSLGAWCSPSSAPAGCPMRSPPPACQTACDEEGEAGAAWMAAILEHCWLASRPLVRLPCHNPTAVPSSPHPLLSPQAARRALHQPHQLRQLLAVGVCHDGIEDDAAHAWVVAEGCAGGQECAAAALLALAALAGAHTLADVAGHVYHGTRQAGLHSGGEGHNLGISD